ncbi:hypothetical protein CVS27_16810 [Arthrobacter glacialis]|uniref:Uncharacterized protein n=2 Tax=Arthrobacter glacialis TaxID=1664 RepID=A0A2S3ZSD7_ARTGL|nr:hypothetical protein CVS27_16810 [Arthrobacter glacialis]
MGLILKERDGGSLGLDFHRPGFRFLIFLVAIISTILLTSACAGGNLESDQIHSRPHNVDMTRDQVETQFDQIEELLTCQQSIHFYDDIYSFAYMRGLTCLMANDANVNVRVFTSGPAMIQNLDSALGLGQPGQLVLLGENWLAIASESIIKNLQQLDSKTSVLSRIDALSFVEQNGTIKPPGASADFCVGWASSVIAETLSSDPRAAYDRKETEVLYPGLLKILDQIIANVPSLQKSIEQDFIIFKSRLSSEMTPIKEHCLSSVENGIESMIPKEP